MAAGTGVCRKRTGSGTASEGGGAQDRRADAHGRQARAWEHAGAAEGCRPEGQRTSEQLQRARLLTLLLLTLLLIPASSRPPDPVLSVDLCIPCMGRRKTGAEPRRVYLPDHRGMTDG